MIKINTTRDAETTAKGDSYYKRLTDNSKRRQLLQEMQRQQQKEAATTRDAETTVKGDSYYKRCRDNRKKETATTRDAETTAKGGSYNKRRRDNSKRRQLVQEMQRQQQKEAAMYDLHIAVVMILQ